MSMKDSFILKVAIRLWLTYMKVPTGVLRSFLTWALSLVIGSMMDKGILKIDLTVDAIKFAISQKEFEKEARAVYVVATKKVYTDAEKEVIRQKYLEILRNFVPVNDRLRNSGKDS
jgi:hypothetical protein